MGCGLSLVKYTLFFFNLVVALLGLTVIGLGVAFQLKWIVIADEMKSHLIVTPWIFIIIGAITFVIAFSGCCGAIRESHCLVVTYAIFLLVIIIAQVVIGVLLFLYGNTIKEGVMTSAKSIFEERQNHDVSSSTEAFINNIQQQFSCCGFRNAQDYGVQSALSLPDSCCNTIYLHDIGGKCTLAFVNPGCEKAISDFYDSWNKRIVITAISIAVIEVAGAISALSLANFIKIMDKRSRRTSRKI